MSIVTLEQLKRKLRWERITFCRAADQFQGQEYYTCRFDVLPEQRSWPSIDLVFDGDVTCFHSFGFSHWHGHYDSWSDPRRNLIAALRGVRGLIKGELCLVEELDAEGKYWGGCLLSPTEIPETLGKKIRRLRRVFFNRPPALEEIDFTRYWEGKHLLVERTYKEKTEKLAREAGMSKSIFE